MTACSDNPPLIRLFIGAPLQNKSEHECLRVLYEALAKSGKWACIFANFHAASRQIDLTVFTEKTTLVIEVKGYSSPVRGGMNGLWEQIGPYGARKIGNAYNQALDAKNALRDEMQRLFQIDGYPNGLVVNVPDIPEDSALTSGDFKVTVAGIDQIERQLSIPSGALLTQNLRETLAKQLHLEVVDNIDAALDEEVFAADRLCDAYIKAFHDFYGPIAAELFDDRYTCCDHEIDAPQVRSMVNRGESGILIHGPSGCGKSLLATSCAIACIEAGQVPIFVSAKNFEGEFLRLLDKEVALLDARSASKLIAAGRLIGKRIILFVDGYNECRDEFKASLTRSLKVFAQRYGAGIVVSTQQDLIRSDLLTTKTVFVKRPSDALKASLARLEKSEDRAENFRSLLQVAGSGLEASLVGQVGAFLHPGASRFVLFDTYARVKLGAAASEDIRILSAFAETLVHRACFSLSVREFDRLCDSTNLDIVARRKLLQSQLLQSRGDRISFVHELFFSAFTAESAIRSTNGDLSRILAILKSPRYFSARTFILGAIEDERIMHEVLERITDQELLAACAQGECGATAKTVVSGKIESVLSSMLTETRDLRFQIIGEGWDGIAIDKESVLPELKEEFSHYLAAIGQGLMDGRYLDVALAACRNVDETIALFGNQFYAEAKLKKIPIRHAMFSVAYVMDREAAISLLSNFVHSGGPTFRRHESQRFGDALRESWAHAETPGQFYFLIGLMRFTTQGVEVAQNFARLLSDIRSHPYHLQLELIHFSPHLRNAEEPYRTEIVKALEASLDKLGVMMNSIIFDALKAFGALDEEEQNYVHVVLSEIQDALGTDNSETDVLAWNLYSCQFDHPFDSVYWEEIQGLDDARQKLLFTKACRGAEPPHLSFLGTLIRRLSEFNDPEMASAIERWTILPDRRSFMPQDAVEVLISAHEALGHLGAELPQSRGEPIAAEEHALLAWAELMYWSSRTDLDANQVATHVSTARSVLLDHSLCASAGALQLTTSRMLWTESERMSLVQRYPELCLVICREALTRRSEQVSYFQHEFPTNVDGIACFAIQVLGDVGNPDDLQLLRSLCDHESYGTASLKAIKKIEERTRIRHG